MAAVAIEDPDDYAKLPTTDSEFIEGLEQNPWDPSFEGNYRSHFEQRSICE